MTDLDPTQQALRDHLLKYAVKRGDFTLKSGLKTSYFLDAKQTAARPEGILLIADAILSRIPDDIDAIGGLTMGADPVAFGVAAIAAARGRELRAFSVRKEVKGHGAGGRIAGPLEPGDRVVITEDCVTRGTSPIEAAEVIREFGAIPVVIMPVIDRGNSCAALAKRANIDFQTILTAPDLGLPFEGGLEEVIN
jgi:orotate phosphoribosyltransferase